MIDPERGAVLVRIVPTHIERVHGPLPLDAIWIHDHNGVPQAPLVGTGAFVDVVVTADSTVEHLSSLPVEHSGGTELQGRYWFSWYTYARAPFGWCYSATPTFRTVPGGPVEEAPIAHVSFLLADRDWRESFDRIDEWVRAEVGPPTTTRGDGKRKWTKRQRRWDFAWGRVDLYYEWRDNSPELVVTWGREDGG